LLAAYGAFSLLNQLPGAGAVESVVTLLKADDDARARRRALIRFYPFRSRRKWPRLSSRASNRLEWPSDGIQRSSDLERALARRRPWGTSQGLLACSNFATSRLNFSQGQIGRAQHRETSGSATLYLKPVFAGFRSCSGHINHFGAKGGTHDRRVPE